MAEFMGSPLANIVVLLALLAALVASAVYLIGRVRASMKRQAPRTSEWMTNFEELHSQGGLSDEEYRTIKAMLAERLQREINHTDETR